MEPKTDDVDTKGRFSSAMDRTPQTLQGSDPPEKLPPMEEALVLLRRIAAAVGGTSAGTERPEGLAPIGLARVASIKGDALDVGQLVQARVALEAQARSLSPTVRCDGTDAELVRAALKAAGEVVEGNADYLAGKLAGVVSGRGARALGEARGSVGHHTDEAVPPATLGQMMSGAWRR